MNYLLNANINPNEPIENIGDIFSYGGGVVLLGVATVFSVLIIVWIALMVFKFIFHDLKLGTKIKAEKPDPKPVPVPSAPVYQPSNDEIIAVIAAAIAAAESEAPAGAKFRVVSFTRK